MSKTKKQIIIFLVLSGIITLLAVNADKNSPTTSFSTKSIFVYEDSSTKQTAEILEQNKDALIFKLTSENKIKNMSSVIDGIAKIHDETLGSESDCCDAEGNSYFVHEYFFNDDKCWLSFRIDKDTRSTLRITETDCKINTPDTPFGSENILTRQ